jgi:hypothetical protein
MTDAVLQEIHAIKDAFAKEHKNDVRAALAAARARQRLSRRRILRLKFVKMKVDC